jgi:uncharacterized membrane protein
MEETVLFHPPIVHFAVVLPIVTMILYLTYLKTKSTFVLKTSEYFLYATAIFMVLAWYTGGNDGKLAYEALFMNSDAGVEQLKIHKNIGTMLAIFTVGVVVMFKIAQKKTSRALNIIVAASLIFVAFYVLKQGKEGGVLVYTYAANVTLPVDDEGDDF